MRCRSLSMCNKTRMCQHRPRLRRQRLLNSNKKCTNFSIDSSLWMEFIFKKTFGFGGLLSFDWYQFYGAQLENWTWLWKSQKFTNCPSCDTCSITHAESKDHKFEKNNKYHGLIVEVFSNNFKLFRVSLVSFLNR